MSRKKINLRELDINNIGGWPRQAQVGFAGPYFITGQGLLVLKSNTDINSDKDLAGKTVCSATGSTPRASPSCRTMSRMPGV